MNQMGSEFETRLSSLSTEQWQDLNRWRPGATWESAWEVVLAAGGDAVAIPVMLRVQHLGAPLGACALAGAAAAALSLEPSLAPAVVDELYGPFAAMLPRERAPLAGPASRRPRLAGWHDLARDAALGAGRR